MRARSRSLPQRQQRQSCVLLPTSHHLLVLCCPPPTASCGPSFLPCLQPMRSGHRLMVENVLFTGEPGAPCLSDWLPLKHQGETGTRKLVAGETTAFRSAAPDICSAVRNFMKHSCTERLHTAAAPHPVLYFTSPLVSSSF